MPFLCLFCTNELCNKGPEIRLIANTFILIKEVAKFFKQDTSLEEFTFSDYQEFVSLWFFVIMTSDSLTIIGSIYKMVIDQRVRLLKRLIVLLVSLPLSCIKEGTF